MEGDNKETKLVLERIEQKLSELTSQRAQDSEKLNQLHSSVVGSENYGIKGLVGRMVDAETELRDYRNVKQKGIGAIVVLSVVWTLIVDYLKSKIGN